MEPEDYPMTGPELDALIQGGELGMLDPMEQRQLAKELKIYRAMVLRLERCVHELVKENDKARHLESMKQNRKRGTNESQLLLPRK
jgi:hypothetical protein